MKIFSSGSCRLVVTINNGRDKVVPIHSINCKFSGINFLGKLHNTKQHMQFIQFIKDEITIPPNILPKFLTSYNNFPKCDSLELLPIKKANLKKEFDTCDWYVFEICSIKLYKINEFEVQHELSSGYTELLQTKEDLYSDLCKLKKMIPDNKKILFHSHFRPNIIYNDATKAIANRELIYNTLLKFASCNKNVFLYDPSVIIQKNLSFLYGINHFTVEGYVANFNCLYDNYFSKNNNEITQIINTKLPIQPQIISLPPKPEIKPKPKPEIKPKTKPEIKQKTKLQNKSEIKPKPKPENKSENKSEIKQKNKKIK